MNEQVDRLDPAARYSTPALEKGLDVVELLAAEAAGLTAREIGARLGRTTGELFRMLLSLERRGYIRRGEDGAYVLTLRLFELAHRHPPTDRLMAAALPEMRRLAERTGQSCHLAVQDAGRILVLARVESPRPWSLLVRVGAAYDLVTNSSGRVLLAFQPETVREAWLRLAGELDDAVPPADLPDRLAAIRAAGHEAGPSDAVGGVVNLSCPLLSRSGRAVAALTMPFLALRGNICDEQTALAGVRAAAKTIAERLGV
jgi:DNA-binding IclR family transcriptional regulator